MTALDRTAYPQLDVPTDAELTTHYTPTAAEKAFALHSARGLGAPLTFLVLFKTFQRLGYFPHLDDVPDSIVTHIATCLDLGAATVGCSGHTLYRYHKMIRQRLGILAYDVAARRIVQSAMTVAAQTMTTPGDLINVAIAELVRQRYELPAFRSLDDLAQQVRSHDNAALFARVLTRLSPAQCQSLDKRIALNASDDWARLKQTPKSATLTHLADLHERLDWLGKLGDVDTPLADVSAAKIKLFAAEARALSATEMRDYALGRRYCLMLCLIHQERVRVRDDCAEMFVKRMAHLHTRAKEELILIRERQRGTTETLLDAFGDVLVAREQETAPDDAALGQKVRLIIDQRGGISRLRDDYDGIACYNGNNYLPLMWRFYRSHRATLFKLVRAVTLRATTHDTALTDGLAFLLDHENTRADRVIGTLDLSFASDAWRRLITSADNDPITLDRRYLEVCIFAALAADLKTGDLCVEGSEAYADYREQLVPMADCQTQIVAYCQQLGLAPTPTEAVTQLRDELTRVADAVDRAFPDTASLDITATGEPILKKVARKKESDTLAALEAAIHARLPQRTILDALCSVQHLTNWTRHFGPFSGLEPRLDQPDSRYVATTFAYGCNLGPVQTARHLRGSLSAKQLAFINRRHIDSAKLDAARRDIITGYTRFRLPSFWGDGTTAAADGTKLDLARNNLISEYHIRYGGYGGIAYHHVSDTYLAIFTHFIACGVWEGVYLLDGLLKNTSPIQPTTIHADTQGQNAPSFGLSHLLGIHLMPRIRNWKDLIFYRPSKAAHYTHIASLFSDVIDWDIIETHWLDMLQVVVSIKAGKILPSTILRKLSNYSRKNKLYVAFRELGRVIRTIFLLRYISNMELRQQITAATNKVEGYNGFSKWLFFGGDSIITDNDPEEQQKRVRYTDLVANAVIFQNVVDLSDALTTLAQEGVAITREDVAALSPYITQHIKRFGEYVLDFSIVPQIAPDAVTLRPLFGDPPAASPQPAQSDVRHEKSTHAIATQ